MMQLRQSRPRMDDSRRLSPQDALGPPAPRIKPITRGYRNCQACGLPTLTCICAQVQPIRTRARFLILTSAREFERASSTGRLLKLLNPASTEVVLWERTRPSSVLLERLRENACYLVFPAETEAQQARQVTSIARPSPLFILIDGTWKEARNIYRRSDYLQALPLLSLTVSQPSAYTLRQLALPGTLCTIEAAIELLKRIGEDSARARIDTFYHLFLTHYRAGRNGHQV